MIVLKYEHKLEKESPPTSDLSHKYIRDKSKSLETCNFFISIFGKLFHH